jgi:hypothetical protein
MPSKDGSRLREEKGEQMGGLVQNNVSSRPVLQPVRRAGCLGYSGILLLVIFLIVVVGHPWALHMGGRWTPAMVWHGYGKMHASTGADYMVWMNIGPMAMASRRSGKRENFQGTAIVCTPQGAAVTMDATGRVDAWLDADGKPVRMFVTTRRGMKPTLSFHLYGQWKGTELVLEDNGSLADSFRADGSAKGYLQGPRAPKENAQVTLRYGKQSEFEAMCRGGQSTF